MNVCTDKIQLKGFWRFKGPFHPHLFVLSSSPFFLQMKNESSDGGWLLCRQLSRRGKRNSGIILLMLALVAGVRFDLSPGPLAGSQTPVFGINSSSRGVFHTDRNCLSSAGLFGFNRMKCDRCTQTGGHSAKLG